MMRIAEVCWWKWRRRRRWGWKGWQEGRWRWRWGRSVVFISLSRTHSSIPTRPGGKGDVSSAETNIHSTTSAGKSNAFTGTVSG